MVEEEKSQGKHDPVPIRRLGTMKDALHAVIRD
jgi:hypothetical protein